MIKKIREKISGNYFFKKYPVSREFVKFCLVGLTNLVFDMGAYWIFSRIFHIYYLLAAVMSFFIAVTWSFFINSRWTFKSESKNVGQYVKFIIANVISIILNLFLLYVFVDFCNFHDLAAKLLATFITSFINFAINKVWTFRNHSKLEMENVS